MPSGAYPRSEEMKQKASGEKSVFWKGGRAMSVKRFMLKKGNKERLQEYQKRYLQRLRNSALEGLGGKCVECNYADKRALQIDHIDGGGSKERKERNFKMSFHKYVLQSFINKENKYQLLCANCNWIKRYEKNEN